MTHKLASGHDSIHIHCLHMIWHKCNSCGYLYHRCLYLVSHNKLYLYVGLKHVNYMHWLMNTIKTLGIKEKIFPSRRKGFAVDQKIINQVLLCVCGLGESWRSSKWPWKIMHHHYQWHAPSCTININSITTQLHPCTTTTLCRWWNSQETLSLSHKVRKLWHSPLQALKFPGKLYFCITVF